MSWQATPSTYRPGSWPSALATVLTAACVQAQDWGGPFTLIPVSAPDMVLEAVLPGNAAGNAVSIGRPTGAANQAWLVAREQNAYAIRPASGSTLVLAVTAGGTDNGIPAVLETDAGKPWQRWAIKANTNGSFSLLAQHAPNKGLDDFGGGNQPGARQDLWDYNPADEHLQWVLKPLTGATLPAEFAAPGRLNPLNIPKGTVKDFTFAASSIFPGTRRTGSVFIPAQYDAAKPACVYVRQDGYNAAEKGLLETLIAAGDMPVTVGVFVRPGELPAPRPGTLGRRNRCFEYDAVGDAYARFLVDELLPFVAKEFSLNLSTSGNDRCIAGGSSGGIAAFNAAWERPDAFSRVYANSGSFVAFRGGHEFPTLVRKVEAKPVRAYLTTGMHDMENCAGDWYLLDQEMDKALRFSGYDYVFHAIDGPHVAGWNEHFPEAMRFIWKGWPAPVQAGPSAPRVRDVILPGAGWTLAAQGFGEARGAACNAKGEVFFADPAADKVFRLGPDGTTGVFLANAERANAVSVGPKNEVYTVSVATRTVLCYDEAGAESICYAREGQMLVATRLGIQICADDGPTQVILPLPDRSRVLGLCLGGADGNTLFAFCGTTIWKRTVKLHAMGAFSRWTEVRGAPL